MQGKQHVRQSVVLAVPGEPWVGKTALLDDYSSALTRAAVVLLLGVGVLATFALARVLELAAAAERQL